jgi:predicted RNA-binding protein with PUA-like domain
MLVVSICLRQGLLRAVIVGVMICSVAHWLMKSEPGELSIDDLYRAKRKRFAWDGVRNYRARNWMLQMQPGEQFFFAHSSTKVPGIAGIAEIVGEAYPDPTQFDADSHYYDAASPAAKPRWVCRDVRFVQRFAPLLPLIELRQHADELGPFHLLQKANRLSVMPVSDRQWDYIVKLVADRGVARK